FRTRLQEVGIELADQDELNAAFAHFKELADKKHEIFDEDLQALVSDSITDVPERMRLSYLDVTSRTGETPVAKISVEVDGVERQASASGSGPVDAAFRALEEIARSSTTLSLHSVYSINEGAVSHGEVTVRLETDGRIVTGNGADT